MTSTDENYVEINDYREQVNNSDDPLLYNKEINSQTETRKLKKQTSLNHFDEISSKNLDAIPNEINKPYEIEEPNEDNNIDYHVRAGRIGGQTTKQRHRDSNFYREIGARGGSSTMAKHSQEYEERRKKGGETTRERYGEEYYHNIAEKAARVKQDATRLRNEAIKALLGDGWKIPTIIKLTLHDMQQQPRLQRHLTEGPVAEYLKTRPDAPENEVLFVSQSGKPLSLANTYTIMERHRP